MASLSLKHIFKVYDGGVKAVNDFCMDIEDKEFIVFVGPSGCGKSTTLRMIAGLEDITAGELRIDDEVVNDREPKDRNIAMVFQNYALYPHMTVYENLAFSLRTMHLPSDEVHKKVIEAAEILGISEYLERKPKALSGGQRQRVALGRAIVRNPKVFLLDEPLSNLDAKLRAAMRTEISLLHERLGTTFIYVTHDQVEAMTMGTRIVVMKSGYVQQIDTPINLYKYPDNIFVAGFIGTPQMNFFDAKIKKNGEDVRFSLKCGTNIDMKYIQADKIPLKYMDGEHDVVFGIRPDGVRINKPDTPKDGDWCSAKATVNVVEVLGGETLVYANLHTGGENSKDGAIVIKADPDCSVRRGDIIDISINLKKFHVFDKNTEKSIRRRIPEQNIIKCDVKDGSLFIENQSFALPNALVGRNSSGVELNMPISALKLGYGMGKATVQWTESIDGKTLYFLKVGELTLFSIEDGEAKYTIGSEVKFDIDMRFISIEECDIHPLSMQNSLAGGFSKEKDKSNKIYNFHMEISDQRLVPKKKLCEKLFTCMGTKIFRTPLEYIFNVSSVCVVREGENVLRGTVTGILDYGSDRYAVVDLGKGNSVNVEYSGNIGEQVLLAIDGDAISVKDTALDIIIA